jgi:hypothetical protein
VKGSGLEAFTNQNNPGEHWHVNVTLFQNLNASNVGSPELRQGRARIFLQKNREHS